MKTIFAFVACLSSLRADLIINQSPPNANALDITNARAADNFTFASSAVVTGVNFWYQTDVFGTKDDLSTLAFAFYGNSGGALGSLLYSGTATPATSVDSANNADFASFAVASLAFSPGTYWLELHAGNSLTDTNGGLNIFWANVDGSPSLTVLENTGLAAPSTHEPTPGFQSLAFQLIGTGAGVAVPEPNALVPVALLAAVAALLKRYIWSIGTD